MILDDRRRDRGGFVRLVASRDPGALPGAQIVGPEASELVGELAVALTHRATLSEAVAEAAE